MIDKIRSDVEKALSCLKDGSSLMIGGFGECGRPNMLIAAVLDMGIRDLVLVSNNSGTGRIGLAALLLSGRVRKMICSYPRGDLASELERMVRAGSIELEVMPQGTLSERMRAAGAGIPAFYCPTGFGTTTARGKETREFNGLGCVLETGLTADVALVKAGRADRWGNLTYDRLARNFSPLMCMAARTVIAEVDEVVELGDIDPEHVVTQGILVDSVVRTQPVDARVWERALA
ncbi:3-oxoacid CoA-transferase subunit A [Ottowia thiooxydans]|uniref:3-oxoacid CoA-transferase subunit A n=1 Tax=Ottowia thiooxydans TaxID=219182 RepID=UPI0004079F8A|nr:3-oxoacid CoA-transferase subunit A [Ottowia thiooxydans]